MAAFASITLNSKVYSPDTISAGTAVWKNRESGTVNGFKTATAKLTSDSSASKAVSRVRLSLRLPVVASEDSTCVCTGDVLHTNQVSVDFVLSNASTIAERTDLLTGVKDYLATATVADLVNNLTPVYG